MSDTLGIDDDVMLLALFLALDDMVDKCLLVIIISLRKQYILGTVGNTAPECYVTGTTSHNLDDRTSLMGSRSITYLVNGFHCCIYGCIKSDRVLCTCDIQIDRARQTNRIDPQCCQLLRSFEGTVTTDNDQSIYSMLLADVCCFFLYFWFNELQASGCLQDRTASLDDLRYTMRIHIYDLFLQKSGISTLNSLDLFTSGNRLSHDCTDGCIHSRCVSTTC